MQNNFDQIPVSEKLNERVDQALRLARKRRRRKTLKRTMIGMGSAAAVFAAVLVLGEANPALAGRLPFIGHFFEQVENEVSYKGDFSKDAVRLIAESEEAEERQEPLSEAGKTPYVQKSGGITITVSEITYTKKAAYLAMSVENEEGFPEDFIRSENAENYALDYDILQIVGSGSIEGIEGADVMLGYLEGSFEDTHTFVGIGRIDLSHFYHTPSQEELEAAGLRVEDVAAEEGLDEDALIIGEDGPDEETPERIAEYKQKVKAEFPDADTRIELPDEFTLTLTISNIWGMLSAEKLSSVTYEDEGILKTEETYVPDQKNYSGTWEFCFDIKCDDSKIETVAVNQTNEKGEGIGTVEKSPYEVSATMLLPENALDDSYCLVICDADGDLLDYQGAAADTYQTWGRNTDTVYVYLCDYDEYMNELKGYYWSEDYGEKRATKTFAQLLDERALYGTKVTFEN